MPDDSSASRDPADRFGRVKDFLGHEGFARLAASFVTIVGLGGVGSHACVALARCGVGRLRIVDFDRVTWSSLNRHAAATPADVGRPKTAVVRDHLAACCPDTRVEALESFFHRETADVILDGRPDIVLDAIDSVGPKVELIRCCVERGLPILSSMGASARSDPSLVRVDDMSRARGCPLARAVKRRLRDSGIRSGVTVVYSPEPARAPLPPDEEDETIRRGRPRRRLPSLSTMPGIFGYALATLAILRLSGEDRS